MRIALGIEYDGHSYCGWQRQPNCISLQQCLETALSQIANRPIKVFCAGRTDAGVHATGQVVHFDSQVVRKESAWTIGVNAHLPPTLSVRWAKGVSSSFHARFSALARHYRYIIDNSSSRPALLSHAVTHVPRLLDVAAMHQAGQALLGEHDFTSFRALQCQSRSPWRHLIRLDIVQQGRYIVIDIKANAFVHHMVRNIVGALVKVGSGQRPVTWIVDLLTVKDRTQGAETAKANGLYLVNVDYPPCFELPNTPLGPLLLAE